MSNYDRKERRSRKRWNDKFERIYQNEESINKIYEPKETGNKIQEIKKVERRGYDDFVKEEEEEEELKGEYKDINQLIDQEVLKRRITFVKSKKQVKSEAKEEGFEEPKKHLIEDEKIIEIMKWEKVFKIGSGLNNLGNTCYLNSALQCLCYTPTLNNYLLKLSNSKSNGIKNLIEIIRDLFKKMIESSNSISPNEVVKNLKRIGSFKLGRQEDSHELIINLIDKMEQILISNLKCDRITKSTNPINKIFGGYFKSQIKTESGYISNTYDPFIDLSLNISNVNSIEKAISLFSQPDLLEGDNKFKNPNTNQYENAKKTTSIFKLPFELIIHLKRFSWNGKKISKFIEFKEILNINNTNFNLHGIIVHSGSSRLSGHYYAFIKAPNQIWYEMNDSYVKQVSIQTVLSQSAYMLFYTKDLSIEKKEKLILDKSLNIEIPKQVIKMNELDGIILTPNKLKERKLDTPNKLKNDTPLKNETPNKIKNDTPNKIKNETPNKIKNDTPSKIKNETPNKLKNETPNKIKNETPNKVKNETPNKIKNETPNKIKNDTPNKIKNETPNKLKNENERLSKKRKFNALEMIELNKGKYQEKIERWDGREEERNERKKKFDEYEYSYDLGKQKKKKKKESLEEFLEENERFKRNVY